MICSSVKNAFNGHLNKKRFSDVLKTAGLPSPTSCTISDILAKTTVLDDRLKGALQLHLHLSTWSFVLKKWLRSVYIYGSYHKIKTRVSLFGQLCSLHLSFTVAASGLQPSSSEVYRMPRLKTHPSRPQQTLHPSADFQKTHFLKLALQLLCLIV